MKSDLSADPHSDDPSDVAAIERLCQSELFKVLLFQSRVMRSLDTGEMLPDADLAETFEDVANRLLDVSERISRSLAVSSH